MAALVKEAGEVISGSLAPKSREAYNKVFQDYQKCVKSLGYSSIVLNNPGLVVLFLSQLFKKGLAASTLLSKISALSYIFELQGGQDPTQHFLVQNS